MVRRHVSLLFGHLQSLANSNSERIQVTSLKFLEWEVSSGVIKAIESNAERAEELHNREPFLAHEQAIEKLKIRLQEAVTDDSHLFRVSTLTTYHARIRNIFDRLLATVSRVWGTNEMEGTLKVHVLEWTCVCCIPIIPAMKTNFLTLLNS